MKYIIQFFSARVLLETQPLPVAQTGLIILLVIMGVTLGLGFGLKIYDRKLKHDRLLGMALESIGKPLRTFGMWGLVYTFFAWQGLPFLGMRLWLVVWFLLLLVFEYKPVKHYFVNLPKIRTERERQKNIHKYTP